VSVAGRMVFPMKAQAVEFLEHIRVEMAPVLILDLSAVSFCDSQGIRALMLAHQLAEASGRSFTIRGVTGNVEQVLRIAGVLDLLTLTA